MDNAEMVAEKHLIYRGSANLIYEPDGNRPPDFVIDGRIAVEVRRLNQNFTVGQKRQSLDNRAVPLRRIFEKLLPSFGPPNAGQSWFVCYDFKRPLEKWRVLRKRLSKTLADFKESPQYPVRNVPVCAGLEVTFIRAGEPHETVFILGGCSDGDEGGWVIPEVVAGLNICLSEKSAKMPADASKYAEWWLLLVNQICPLTIDDAKEIQTHVTVPRIWNKVIVVDWNDHTRFFEL